MSGSASWCFIANAFRRANEELREGLELNFGRRRCWRRQRRKRTCWPFEWPCWMEREGEWRSSRGNNGCHSPLPICGFGEPRSLIQNVHFSCVLPSRHSFLFSAIPSPFHFPKHGRHASSATVSEFFSPGCSTTPTQPFHSTSRVYSPTSSLLLLRHVPQLLCSGVSVMVRLSELVYDSKFCT